MSDHTILVVDDSRASRLLIVSVLKKLLPECIIFEASNGDEALTTFTKEKINLAILDMNMPGITGLELAEKIKPLYPQIRLAMLTANTQEATQEAAKKIGISFFKKPVTPIVLSEITKLLG